MNGLNGSIPGYSNHVAKYVDIEFIDSTTVDQSLMIKSAVAKSTECDLIGENQPLKEEMAKVRHLLRFFRCAFYEGLPRSTLYINYFMWISAFICHTYVVVALLYMSSTIQLDNKSLIFIMVRSFTSFQNLLTMSFTMYWQRKAKFKTYVRVLHEAQQSEGCKKYQKDIGVIVRYLYLIVAFIVLFCGVIAAIQMFDVHVDLVPPEMADMIRRNKLVVIPQFIFLVYSAVCTSASMFIYCIFTYGAVLEVRFFNERIDAAGRSGVKVTVQELMKLIIDHAKISKAIRNLDSMCEVFAFVMIGCTIPITVFTTLQLLSSKGLPPINLVVSLPMFLFCVVLLTSLTAIPSQAYTVLDRSKHHLYGNTLIWKTFDKDVFQIANSLAAHLNQPDLGMSVWGFALISKPLILTTISVMVTCMAFLLELRKRPTS